MKAFVLYAVFLSLFIDPVSDYYLIKAHKAIKHARGLLLWSIGVLIPISVFVALEWKYDPINATTFAAQLGIMLPSLRWIIHDTLLNQFRGLPIEYYSIAEGAATTDRLLRWLDDRNIPPVMAKVGALLISWGLCLLVPFII